MDFTQLTYFIAVVETSTLTKAAESLHISQPALSKAVARLEDEVGTELFDRVGRQIVLNSNGELLYNWAKKTLSDYEVIQDLIENSNARKGLTVTLATSNTNFTGPIIRGFHEQNPDILIYEEVINRRDFPAVLFRKNIDCVFSSLLPNDDTIHHHLLCRGQLYLFVPTNHRLASYKSVSIQEVREEPLTISSMESEFYKILIGCFQNAGFSPKIKSSVDRSNLEKLTLEGKCVTIGSRFFARDLKRSRKCARILIEEDYCHRDYYLLWKDTKYKGVSREFIDFVIHRSKSLILQS